MDIIERLKRAAKWTEAEFDVSEKEMLEDAAKEIDQLRGVVSFVETWVCNPASAYSTGALEGLFGMTRDKIASLSHLSQDK